MVVSIRGKLYSSWEEAEPHMSIYRNEQKKFCESIVYDDCSKKEIEAGRYRIVAGYGDPWSHRVLIARSLLKLQNIISLSVVNPKPSNRGWQLGVHGNVLPHEDVYQLYLASDPEYTGRITVPLLWDHKTGRIINNESNQILRVLQLYADRSSPSVIDLYPQDKEAGIEQLVDFIFDNINNGVYKVGFAPTQKVFEKSTVALFAALEDLEARLAYSRFLLGEELTAADICLFVTLIRFDTIYYPYLRCNKKRLQDFKHLWLYTKDIYHFPDVKETIHLEMMMQTYYGLEYLNPTQVIPNPPTIDFGEGVEILHYDFYSGPL